MIYFLCALLFPFLITDSCVGSTNLKNKSAFMDDWEYARFEKEAKEFEEQMYLTNPAKKTKTRSERTRAYSPAEQCLRLYQQNLKVFDLLDRYQQAMKEENPSQYLMAEFFTVLIMFRDKDYAKKVSPLFPERIFKEILLKIQLMKSLEINDETIRLCKKALSMEIPQFRELYEGKRMLRVVPSEEQHARQVRSGLKITLADAYLATRNLEEATKELTEVLKESIRVQLERFPDAVPDLLARKEEFIRYIEIEKQLQGDRFDFKKTAVSLIDNPGSIEEKIMLSLMYYAIKDPDLSKALLRDTINQIIEEGKMTKNAEALFWCVLRLGNMMNDDIERKVAFLEEMNPILEKRGYSVRRELTETYLEMAAQGKPGYSVEFCFDLIDKWKFGSSLKWTLVRELGKVNGKENEALDIGFGLLEEDGIGNYSEYRLLHNIAKRDRNLLQNFYKQLDALSKDYTEERLDEWWGRIFEQVDNLERAIEYYRKVNERKPSPKLIAKLSELQEKVEAAEKAKDEKTDEKTRIQELSKTISDRLKSAEDGYQVLRAYMDTMFPMDKHSIYYDDTAGKVMEKLQSGEINWQTSFLLAHFFFRKGDKTKALEYYRRAAEMKPEVVLLDGHLSDLILDAGNYERSIKVYEEFCRNIEINSLHLNEKQKILGDLCVKAGKMNDAMRWYERSLRYSSTDNDLFQKYLNCARDTKQLPRAVIFLEKLVENYPLYDEPRKWLNTAKDMASK